MKKDTKMVHNIWHHILVMSIAIIFIGGLSFCAGRWHRSSEIVGNCTDLSLSEGEAEGAAGTIYKNAVLTNDSDDTCQIIGYPAVFMQDDEGMQVGNSAVANQLYNPTIVTLDPGEKAHTVVAFPQQGNFPAGECSGPGSSMKMYVPGLVSAVVADWSDYSCPGFSVTAIQPGDK